jgi:hypothetical protein
MPVYSFRIFDKQGTCLFRHQWRETAEASDEDDTQLLFGLLFSLKQFAVKMDPKEVGAYTRPHLSST